MPMLKDAQQPGAPVPPPEDPGAGAPPVSSPNEPAPTGGPAAVQEGPDLGLPEEQATAAEQQEYERAMGALQSVLYSDDSTAKAIQDMLNPQDPIGSTAKTAIMVINQIDEQIDLDEAVVAQMAGETVEMLTELGEARHNIEYSESDLTKIMGATWEGVMEMFGVEEDDYRALMADMSEEQVTGLQGFYEGAVNG